MPAYNPDTNISDTPNPVDTGSQCLAEEEAQTDQEEKTMLVNSIDTEVVDVLHDLCGVYTRPVLVNRLLDRVGWVHSLDLSSARLLEPSAGDGAFVIEAVRRLVRSFVHRGIPLTIKSLRDRILAYELVSREAEIARARLVAELQELGVHASTARACARAWVRNEDFLLADLQEARFSHIVGNPPYVRWSKIPNKIKSLYAERLPSAVAKGDLYLPFLQRSFELLARNGRCVYVCSDRWHYNEYADAFRARWCGLVKFETEQVLDPHKVFIRNVNVQAEILTVVPHKVRRSRRSRRPTKGQTLKELGCSISVGPALGVTPAFVLEPDEDDVEPELVHNWLDSKDVLPGAICWSGRRVISPFDKKGNLVNLRDYPIFAARLKRYEERLRSRYVVRTGGRWYRTIEKIQPLKWAAPKLLIPEVAKTPRLAVDLSGSIPSHGLYAIFCKDGQVRHIYDRLKDGKLSDLLAPIAPTIKGGYRRCYRRFLERIEI